MIARRVSPAGVAVIRHYEGCELTAYPDPGTGGDPWTIGFGRTGPEVRRGLVWTQQQADEALVNDLTSTEVRVDALAPMRIPRCQFDALVSFAYNVGVQALRGSTLLLMLTMGNPTGAADQFLRWNRGGGKVLHGLTRRRTAERALFLGATAEEAIQAGDAI